MSRNTISANPEHYIFKIFWGSMPPDPPRRPKKKFSRSRGVDFPPPPPPNKKSWIEPCKPNIINSKNQKDMGTLNDQTIEKCDTIKNAGYNHVSTYVCQLAKNKDFRKFAENFTQEIVEPLNPRDAFYGGITNATKLLYNFTWIAFYGGRTNATKLLYNFKDNECGRYVDFCSLYPTVQYYQKYPTGHPTKIFNPEKYDKSWYGPH